MSETHEFIKLVVLNKIWLNVVKDLTFLPQDSRKQWNHFQLYTEHNKYPLFHQFLDLIIPVIPCLVTKEIHVQIWVEGFAGHVWMVLSVHVSDLHTDWFTHPAVCSYVCEPLRWFVDAWKWNDFPICKI